VLTYPVFEIRNIGDLLTALINGKRGIVHALREFDTLLAG
jgi:hypothetical protein